MTSTTPGSITPKLHPASIVITPMTYDDLPGAARVQLSNYRPTSRIFSLIDPEKLPVHERLTQTELRMKRYLDSGDKVLLKASLAETGELMGIAIWQKPGRPVREPEHDENEMTEEEKRLYQNVNIPLWQTFNSQLVTTRDEVLGSEPYWYLYLLSVHPAHQGQGVGSQLLNWGIATADASEPKVAIYLEASPEGQRLYARRGFEIVAWVEVSGHKFPGMKRKAGYLA